MAKVTISVAHAQAIQQLAEAQNRLCSDVADQLLAAALATYVPPSPAVKGE